jgi:hypothetical protein
MKNASIHFAAPGAGRVAVLVGLAALALLGGGLARADNRASTGNDIRLVNQFLLWVVDSTRAASYLNDFDVQATRGPWLIAARFEVDEETRVDPTRALGFERRFAEYRDEHATLRAGTYYATFGRGLLLRAEEDPLVRLDRDIDGFYGTGHYRSVLGQVLVGRPRNDETHERDDLLAGAELSVQATPELSLSGGYVRRDAAAALGTSSAVEDSSLGRPVEELAGGNLRWAHGAIDAYLEAAKRFVWGTYDPLLGWTGVSGPEGRALYGSLTVGVPGYTVLIEGKDYLDYGTPYATLPPANAAGMPTNDGSDDRGFGVTLTASPRDDLTFDAAGSHASSRELDPAQERSSVEARVRKDWWGRGSLQAGVEWTEESELIGVTGYPYRKYAGPGVNASYYFGAERTLMLHSKLLAREDQEVGTEILEYTEVSADLTFALSPMHAITASLIRASERLPHYGNEDTWASLEYHWTISVQHELKIKAGSERGGIICSGGVCHDEPPFSGVRLEFLSRL